MEEVRSYRWFLYLVVAHSIYSILLAAYLMVTPANVLHLPSVSGRLVVLIGQVWLILNIVMMATFLMEKRIEIILPVVYLGQAILFALFIWFKAIRTSSSAFEVMLRLAAILSTSSRTFAMTALITSVAMLSFSIYLLRTNKVKTVN